MNNLGQNPVFWAVLVSGAAVLFVLPVIIGMARDVPRLGLVVMLTLLGLVTGGAGWAGALVLALRLPRRRPVRYITPSGHPGRLW